MLFSLLSFCAVFFYAIEMLPVGMARNIAVMSLVFINIVGPSRHLLVIVTYPAHPLEKSDLN